MTAFTVQCSIQTKGLGLDQSVHAGDSHTNTVSHNSQWTFQLYIVCGRSVESGIPVDSGEMRCGIFVSADETKLEMIEITDRLKWR